MLRKVVAASFVTLWLVLLGVEFSEDAGFLDYDDPGMDRAVVSTLASLGEAIKISDDVQITQPDLISAIDSALLPPVLSDFSLSWFRKESKALRVDVPLYKLHRAFLI